MSSFVVSSLSPDDVAGYRELRLYGLQESPMAFGSSYEEEVEMSLPRFAVRLQDSPDKFTLGAWVGSSLVGTVGFGRSSALKQRHKGMLYAMYVHPDQRRMGCGRSLVEALLNRTRSLPGLDQIQLSVNADNPAAIALYESLGFVAFGREPRALLVDGVFHDEVHMVLSLPAVL